MFIGQWEYPDVKWILKTSKKSKIGDTRNWTRDLSICSRMLYPWAISPWSTYIKIIFKNQNYSILREDDISNVILFKYFISKTKSKVILNNFYLLYRLNQIKWWIPYGAYDMIWLHCYTGSEWSIWFSQLCFELIKTNHKNDFQLRNGFQNVTTPPVCRPDKVVW